MVPVTAAADPKKEREISDEEKALCGDFKKRIDAVERLNEFRFRQYETNRQYVQGKVHDDGAKGLVRTNLIYSTIATLLPQVYAKDPDLSCSPSEAVDPSEYKLYKQFGKTLEVVLGRKLVKEGKLKRRAKASVRAAMTCELGWVKVTYQKRMEEDPAIQGRIEDIQGNLRRLQALAEKARDPETVGADNDLDRANLEAQLKSLEERVEVVVEKGIVIDKLLSEAVLILDPTIRDFDEYQRSSAIAQQMWFDEDSYYETFGYKPGAKATIYRAAEAGKNPQQNSPASDDRAAAFYCVYEIWDKRTNTVYTWCKGEEGWCRPSFRPARMGRRWYPFFALSFNPVDGQFYPMSDVQLLIELQDEYNTTRTNFAEHRKKHLPVRVVRMGGNLTPEDVKRIQEADLNEVIVVNGTPGAPLQDDLAILPHPPIDPQVYDTTPIRGDIEMVSGAQDSVRGSVLKAKTATEAEIMQQGLMSRTAERQDAIEDWISDMAEYTAQILLQEMPVNEVMEVAGQQAVWPTLNKDQIFDLVNLEIKAGSTGKPNKMKEREQWIELVPVVENTMTKVTELRAMGQPDLADAMTELARETFRRFDERIDVDNFLPPSGTEGDGTQEAMAQIPQMQMQMQQDQEMIMQLQQELQKTQQELQAAEQQLQTRDQELAMKRDVAMKTIDQKSELAAAQRAQETADGAAERRHQAEMQAQTHAAEAEQAAAQPQAQASRGAKVKPQPRPAAPLRPAASAPIDISLLAHQMAQMGAAMQSLAEGVEKGMTVTAEAVQKSAQAQAAALSELARSRQSPIVVEPKPGGGYVIGRPAQTLQ